MKIIDTFPVETTLENLQVRFSGSYEAAIQYGGHAVVAAYTWDHESRDMICVGAVYAYTSENRNIDDTLRFIKESEISFEDVGHALEWGINLAKLLDNDPSRFRGRSRSRPGTTTLRSSCSTRTISRPTGTKSPRKC